MPSDALKKNDAVIVFMKSLPGNPWIGSAIEVSAATVAVPAIDVAVALLLFSLGL